MKLYRRELYLKRMRGFYDNAELIKVISGVRRCGKSSLMQTVIEELNERSVPKENIIYLNLDKRPYKRVKDADALESVIDKRSSGVAGLKYLFIDEIQNVDRFEEVINAFREEGDYSVFITGSNSYLLSGELATKLTGRYLEFRLSTLSFYEYIEMKKFYGKPIADRVEAELNNYILEGGFPLTVSLDAFEEKRFYVKNVVAEIFEKDIKKNKRIKNKELFNKIQTYIINNFGSTTSVSSLCDYLTKTSESTVRKQTVYNYLDILENARIINRCRRFDLKSKKSLNGGEKFYLSDLSFYFLNNVDNKINYGPVLENIVYNYAASAGYEISIGKIGDLEVDFILRDMDLNYSYVQVARYIDNGNTDARTGRNITEEREYRPLETIRDNYPKYLLTLDSLLQKRNGIIHENIIDFMLGNKRF